MRRSRYSSTQDEKKRLSEYWTNLNEIMTDQTDIPPSSNNSKKQQSLVTKNVFIHHFMRRFLTSRRLMIPKKASLTCTTWSLSLAYFIYSSYRRAAFFAPPRSHDSSSVNLTPNRSVPGNAHTAEFWNNCGRDAATFLKFNFSLLRNHFTADIMRWMRSAASWLNSTQTVTDIQSNEVENHPQIE